MTIAILPEYVKDASDDVKKAYDKAIDALKKAGGNIKFTVYPEASHDSWTETYNNPELYKWFLSHTRKK